MTKFETSISLFITHFALSRPAQTVMGNMFHSTLRLRKFAGMMVAFVAMAFAAGIATSQPPAPTIDFTDGTPDNPVDKMGKVVSGTVQVKLKWDNAPVGGGNSIKTEYWIVKGGGKADVLSTTVGVENLGASGKSNSALGMTPGDVMYAKIYLYDSNNKQIADKKSANYTVK
ncbi:MAG: hypothetical protein K2X82_26295 [Gemmataceae bacterium]|nr:hypothetical protein [Gemmataceae bacterium]